jgi:uncharacterized membrane protein YkvA (DUF1232 family)
MTKSKMDTLSLLNGDFIKKSAESVSDADLETIDKKAEAIGSKFRSHPSLRKFIKESVLLISLIRDYAAGRYKTIPWWAISATAFTLLYVFNPFDLIPDMIPGFGSLDDATVVTACLALISHELNKYGAWKKEQGSDAE